MLATMFYSAALSKKYLKDGFYRKTQKVQKIYITRVWDGVRPFVSVLR